MDPKTPVDRIVDKSFELAIPSTWDVITYEQCETLMRIAVHLTLIEVEKTIASSDRHRSGYFVNRVWNHFEKTEVD